MSLLSQATPLRELREFFTEFAVLRGEGWETVAECARHGAYDHDLLRAQSRSATKLKGSG